MVVVAAGMGGVGGACTFYNGTRRWLFSVHSENYHVLVTVRDR